MSKKWDRRLILLAMHVAGWSKDRTQVGAVIAHGNRVRGIGYNGLPSGIKDRPARLRNRELKLALTLHAEQNALAMAGPLAQGATLYTWPLPPCSRCAALAIQAGVRRVVSLPPPAVLAERWGDSLRLAQAMCREAGIAVDMLDE